MCIITVKIRANQLRGRPKSLTVGHNDRLKHSTVEGAQAALIQVPIYKSGQTVVTNTVTLVVAVYSTPTNVQL